MGLSFGCRKEKHREGREVAAALGAIGRGLPPLAQKRRAAAGAALETDAVVKAYSPSNRALEM
jgi:hypothetical protein